MSEVQRLDFFLRGEHIALDALLKASGVAESGGRAKVLIGEGAVLVDGQPETRRACKIRAGQVVNFSGVRIAVRAAQAE